MNEIEAHDIDSLNALDKLKTIIREYEKLDTSQVDIDEKRILISDNLRSTIEMLGDARGETLSKIQSIIEEYVANSKMEMLIFENSLIELKNSYNMDKVMKQDFVEKQHVFRQSLLSTMFMKDKNFSALYFMIVTFFLWLVVWVFVDDYNNLGKFDFKRIYSLTFSGFSTVALTWIFMFLYAHLIVFYIKIIEFYSNRIKKINYIPVLIVYLIYQVCIYVFASIIVFSSNFKIACGMIIGCEMARFSMKIHSYFREKLLYGLKEFHPTSAMFSPMKKRFSDDKIPDIRIESFDKEIRKFVNFLFCPSLIYRDKYPRLISFNYGIILAHLMNFFLCFICLYILFRYICSPYFTSIKLRNYYSLIYFCYDCCRLAIPGTFFLITAFFLLLHTWLNLWSEVLRFGDRRFYEDWWNCTNFEEWYRKWNMVVHEWLYYYVYNDVVRFAGRSSRLFCKIMVFLLSVIIHEIIVWQSIGFFFPILSFFFGGPGIIFTYIKPKKKHFNILFWLKLFLGLGILFCLFMRETLLREVIDHDIGLIHHWHSYVPRSILMFSDSYKTKIQSSNKY